MRMKRRCLVSLLLLVSVALARSASAQIMSYDRWKIDATPYFWLSGLNGDVTVEGTRVPINLSFSDISEFISWGISVHVEARKRLWILIADVRYRNLNSQEEFQSTVLRNTLAEGSVGYWVIDWRRFSVTADVIAGLRYVNMRAEIRDASGVPSQDEGWVDPLVGGRVAWKPGKAWTISFRGDVGGFGIGSKFSYNAGLFGGWRFNNLSVILGYRAWYADYESGSGADLFRYDMTTHGPGIGMTFHFGG
jgi:hypothetical protein